MPTIEVSKFEDIIVLHFGTNGHTVNAYTLASTLVSFADAAKRANATINAGHDIEVVVEALGEGSFRAKLKTIYKAKDNLFSASNAVSIVCSMIATYLYTSLSSDQPEITINTDEVIVEHGDTKVIVPRKVYEATQNLEKDDNFRASMSETFKVIKDDPSISSFSVVESIDAPDPEAVIPRDRFSELIEAIEPKVTRRVIPETVELRILKAILEKTTRKWEFVWRDNVISAPILDDSFYERFSSHDITIAPGDILKCTMEITQVLQNESQIYINKSYKITSVSEHVAVPKQTSF